MKKKGGGGGDDYGMREKNNKKQPNAEEKVWSSADSSNRSSGVGPKPSGKKNPNLLLRMVKENLLIQAGEKPPRPQGKGRGEEER